MPLLHGFREREGKKEIADPKRFGLLCFWWERRKRRSCAETLEKAEPREIAR